MHIRKVFSIFLMSVLMVVSLAGCGGKSSSAGSAREATGRETAESVARDDAELSVVVTETDEAVELTGAVEPENVETEAVETDEPTSVETSSQEPSGSGNVEDYWEGDDFFDLEGYALANGMTHVVWKSVNEETVQRAEGLHVVLVNADTKWEVHVFATLGCMVQNYDMGVAYTLFQPEQSVQNPGVIRICKENSIMLGRYDIQTISIILDCLKNAGPNDSDPFINSGLDRY